MTRRTPFMESLERRWVDGDTLLCVGLDPDAARLPAAFSSQSDPLFAFCAAMVDATADLVCAFKPQMAYFAAEGAEAQLARLIDYIHERYPHLPVILDAKRGDIADTASLYAREAFERYDADAVTVNPYLGPDSIAPYLAYPDRGVIVLCRTSNPDSGWLQDYPEHAPVFLRVAQAARDWNEHGNVMLVAGATHAHDLARIRCVADDMPLLVPGVGAQGGDLEAVVRAGRASRGHGLVINASRSVLYADDPRAAAGALRDAIRTLMHS